VESSFRIRDSGKSSLGKVKMPRDKVANSFECAVEYRQLGVQDSPIILVKYEIYSALEDI
jgi:hypothetical protein